MTRGRQGIVPVDLGVTTSLDRNRPVSMDSAPFRSVFGWGLDSLSMGFGAVSVEKVG